MKELPGTLLEINPFKTFFKVGDLVNYEGPLLSLFSNERGDLYLYDWSDKDTRYNRWLIFRITLDQLNHYLNGNLSHYQLITTCYTDNIYSVDIDGQLNYHNIRQLNVDEIPPEYLPKSNVLHDDEESPHLDKIKVFIQKLELKKGEILAKKWQDKFNIPIAQYKQMMQGRRKIVNREQLLTV